MNLNAASSPVDRRWRWLSCLLATAVGIMLLLPGIADAQRRGGGGRSGAMARSSVSGANRASQQAMRGSGSMASRSGSSTRQVQSGARPATQPSSGTRQAQAGSRQGQASATTKQAQAAKGSGNRVNTGDV